MYWVFYYEQKQQSDRGELLQDDHESKIRVGF